MPGRRGGLRHGWPVPGVAGGHPGGPGDRVAGVGGGGEGADGFFGVAGGDVVAETAVLRGFREVNLSLRKY